MVMKIRHNIVFQFDDYLWDSMHYGSTRAKDKSITVFQGFKNRSVAIVKKSLLFYVLLRILQWLLNKYSCFGKVSETFCSQQSSRHLLA